RAGLSKSAVSLIELDNRNPKINTLKRLLDVFNISLAQFFSETRGNEKVIFREEDRTLLLGDDRTFKIELLIPYGGGRLIELTINTIQPHRSFDSTYRHEGQEAGYVIEGEVVLTLNNEDHYLKAGECFFFSSTEPHTIKNVGKKVAKVLWVIVPPTF
ncbi:MAG: helix-turn-helix domain-containing protein, partial [Nitrospinota bacterium]